MFEVSLTSQAEKIYLQVDSKTSNRFDKVFEQLEQGNFKHNNIRALQGPLAGSLRYRMGKWRIIFKINYVDNEVLIEAITTRGGAYR